jgi:hypothetical protein
MLRKVRAIFFISASALALSACGGGAISPPQDSILPQTAVHPTEVTSQTTIRIVPDSQVDSVIDPNLSPSEHAIVKEALLAVPPSERANGIIVETPDGSLHASSRALFAFEQQQQLQHAHFHPSFPSDAGSAAPGMTFPSTNAAACPTRSIGGSTSGPYRRVYIGCTGFTEQLLNFNSTHCKISDYINTGNDLHGVYTGAYGVTGVSGEQIDAGLIYTRTSLSDNGTWQPQIILAHHATVYGSNVNCGQGGYSMTLTLNVVNSTTNQWVLGTNMSGPIMSVQFSNSLFPSTGSNFVFRRLTAIGQDTQNFNSGEWFGFADNGSGGPDLSTPDIGYTYTAVCCSGGAQVQFEGGTTSPNAYAERNPKVYTNKVDVICGHYAPYWQSPGNFLDYEGIDLNNSSASGTFPYTNCYDG